MSTRIASLLVALATASCVPSLDHLVASRRYEDAVCQVRTRSEAERVAAAIEQSAGQRVHAYAVHDEELTRALGDRGHELDSKVSFVRVVTAANELPGRSVTTSAWVGFAQKTSVLLLSGASYPSDDQASFLFALTGERLPVSVTRTEMENPGRELLWGVVTLGLKPLLFGTRQVTRMTTPGRVEFLSRGPAAMAIFDGLNRHGGWTFALPASIATNARVSVDLTLTTSDEDGQRCTLSLRYESPLGARGLPWPASVDERFRDGAHPVVEPGVERTFSVSNAHGSWSSAGDP